MLEKVLLFKEVAQEGEFYLFEVNKGGNGASVIVEHNTVLPKHDKVLVRFTIFAFRVEDRAVLEEWIERISSVGLPSSVM